VTESESLAPTVHENRDRGRFELLVGGQVAGIVTYRLESDDDADVVVLDHTRIKPAYEGRGLGSKLARGVIARLRDAGETVRAECPFICSWLRRNPDLAHGIALDPHEDSDYAWEE